MAWSERLPTGKYRGTFRDSYGRKRTAPGGPFTHKAEALRAAAAAESAARRESWRDHAAGMRPWSEWSEAWWLTRTVEPGTLLTQASIRDVHLLPRWGNVPLVSIRRGDVKAWARQLLDSGLAPATVQRILALLSASLKGAVEEGILDRNPAASIRLPMGQQAVERYLTGAELDAICTELPTLSDRLVAETLTATGLRWGELAGLHRDRVDWARGFIRVVEVHDEKTGHMKAYPKGRRTRVVPVPRRLLDQLAELPIVGQDCGVPHRVGDCRGPLLFTSPEGRVLRVSNWARTWRAAVVRSGVGHARIHDLRHSFASWLIQGGVPLAEIGRLMGHQSTATTAKYAHLGQAPMDTVVEAIERARTAASLAYDQ